MADLTHMDRDGNARMVEVGGKAITKRTATAEGWITLSPEAFMMIEERTAKKGDVLVTAQLAGIQGAKRTSDLIPLCHPIPLSGVDVFLTTEPQTCKVWVKATAKIHWRTGVEMEALTAVSTALLTVYDMLKAVDRGMEIGGVRLLEKHGGDSGSWVRGG